MEKRICLPCLIYVAAQTFGWSNLYSAFLICLLPPDEDPPLPLSELDGSLQYHLRQSLHLPGPGGAGRPPTLAHQSRF